MEPIKKSSTTEMYSHVNMAVVGSNATRIQDTGRYADVNAFANDVGQMKRVPIKTWQLPMIVRIRKRHSF